MRFEVSIDDSYRQPAGSGWAARCRTAPGSPSFTAGVFVAGPGVTTTASVVLDGPGDWTPAWLRARRTAARLYRPTVEDPLMALSAESGFGCCPIASVSVKSAARRPRGRLGR